MVALVTEKPKTIEEPPLFVGSMRIGVAYITLIMIIGVVMSGDFCWWSKHEIIFQDRSAPKFIFDLARAIFIIPYMIFWAWA